MRSEIAQSWTSVHEIHHWQLVHQHETFSTQHPHKNCTLALHEEVCWMGKMNYLHDENYRPQVQQLRMCLRSCAWVLYQYVIPWSFAQLYMPYSMLASFDVRFDLQNVKQTFLWILVNAALKDIYYSGVSTWHEINETRSCRWMRPTLAHAFLLYHGHIKYQVSPAPAASISYSDVNMKAIRL